MAVPAAQGGMGPPIILPPKAAPRRSVPAAQGGMGPPILAAKAPPASSYHQQIAAAAYQPHGSFSPAGIPPVPHAALPSGLPQLSAQQSVQQQNQRILASYLHGSSQPFSFLTKLPGFATKTVDSHLWDVNPLAKGWGNISVDMGLDANAAPGTPILAPNDSKVVGYDPNWYNGQPYEQLVLTAGPHKGTNYYVAEQITGPNSKSLANADSLPPVGTTIKQGQPVARYATSGTGIEIGLGTPQVGTTLAAANGNGAYGVRHGPGGTPEGQQFLHTFVQGGKDPGQLPHSQGQPLRIPQGTKPLLGLLPSNVRKATVAQVQQPGQPGAAPTTPARPISSGAGLTVKGAPVTPQQIQTANTILGVAHKLGVSKDAAAAAIYTAIYESGLTAGDPANSLGYGGALAGSVSHFNVNDTVGQAKALLLGNSGAGYQGGGVVSQLAHGASIPEAAVRTEVPSIWPSNSYATESGYGSDARAIAEAQAFVKAYGGFGGGQAAPITGGSAGGSAPSGSSGMAPSSSGGSAPVAPSQSGGAPVTGDVTGLIPTSAAAGTSPQDAAAQQQAAILSSFLSGQGTGANPWNVGPSAKGFGSSPSLFTVGALPSATTDLHSVALKSLQALVPGMRLTNPRKKP